MGGPNRDGGANRDPMARYRAAGGGHGCEPNRGGGAVVGASPKQWL
jgi:hypothetical protein